MIATLEDTIAIRIFFQNFCCLYIHCTSGSVIELIQIKIIETVSATSSHVLVPFEPYRFGTIQVAQKNLPQIGFSNIFPCILYVKTKLNSLGILQKQNLFKNHNYASQMASNIEHPRRPSAPTMGWLLVLLKYTLTSRKQYAPRMSGCSTGNIFVRS